jgi:hypothetical protein
MQLPEKYKDNFDVSSKGPTKHLYAKRSPCIFQIVISLSRLLARAQNKAHRRSTRVTDATP